MNQAALNTWLPYCGAAPLPAHWLSRWNFDPFLLALIAVAGCAALFLHRDTTGPRRLLIGAIALFAILFISPLCALGSAMFTVRTLHHVALLAGLAPLLAAIPAVSCFAGKASLGLLTGVQVGILWAWHAPALYAAALSSDRVFWAMQTSLLASAVIWWARLRQAEAGPAVIALLATMVLTGILGALLTFAGSALYAPHWLTTQAWGLSPLEDQQLAGIIMWAPASAIYLVLACTLLYRSLGRSNVAPSSLAAR